MDKEALQPLPQIPRTLTPHRKNRKFWHESVIYQIYPRSFKDSNGDGIGDLNGIYEKLDYIKGIGVDIIWLCPIYMSPNKDNGYDISDYQSVLPEFGTMEDFEQLLNGVHERDMKLLMDLVVNHSSDQHRWFQESRKSTDNPYRDYYFWRKKPNNWPSFFGGSAWEYDPVTSEYYLHLFTKEQPDLNWENPEVRKEVYSLMKFWLDKGIDGFRIDTASLISKRLDFLDTNTSNFNDIVANVYANGPRVHDFLNEMNHMVLSKYNVMTVGEGVGITPENVNNYVGINRRELDMVFHFGHMFIDQGPGGRFDPIPVPLPKFKKAFQEWHNAVGDKGWLNIFLDNHDFSRMVSRFGNDGKYRVESAKMLAMLLLTMRGTPCIFQGTEIGMTNVVYDSLEDYTDIETQQCAQNWREDGNDMGEFLKRVQKSGRENARTPMQWSGEHNAGFTTGKPWLKVNPNYLKINVEDDAKSSQSISKFYKKMIKIRKSRPCLIYAGFEQVSPENETIFGYRRSDCEEEYLVVLNFSDQVVNASETPSYETHELIISSYELDESNTEGQNPFGPLQPWEGRLYLLKR